MLTNTDMRVIIISEVKERRYKKMKTYRIFVCGFQIGTEELTAKEVEEFNNSGIIVVPVGK